MNANRSAESREDFSWPHPARSRDQRTVEVIELLQQGSAMLDSMWSDALLGARGEAEMRLGEAIQGVHRALIALDAPNSL